MGKKKKIRKGWAKTKDYPHKQHPAKYRRTDKNTVDYLTFTHHDVVTITKPNGEQYTVCTFPLTDNISKKERQKNAQTGKNNGENKSYVYPAVFRGKRSALGVEVIDEFDPIEEDKKLIEQMFGVFPLEEVPVTGGKNKHKKSLHKKRT